MNSCSAAYISVSFVLVKWQDVIINFRTITATIAHIISVIFYTAILKAALAVNSKEEENLFERHLQLFGFSSFGNFVLELLGMTSGQGTRSLTKIDVT